MTRRRTELRSFLPSNVPFPFLKAVIFRVVLLKERNSLLDTEMKAPC